MMTALFHLTKYPNFLYIFQNILKTFLEFLKLCILINHVMNPINTQPKV